MRTIKLAKSKEEIVATKIGKELSDFSLDLEAIGFHLAKSTPFTVYSRAIEVLESAQFNYEEVEYNRGYYSDRFLDKK